MSKSDRQLLTIGVFILIIVVAIVLDVAGVIGWSLIVPVVLVLSVSGQLLLVRLQAGKPQKYERSSFSTMALGLRSQSQSAEHGTSSAINWLYSLIVILLVWQL